MQAPESGSLFLVGPMGAGKSTVGRHLARGLQKAFVDSDRVIEERTGASISLIFEIEGEAGFRQRESQVIAELTRRRDIILATGGGAVLHEENRHCLTERGFVIYLRAPLDLLVERTTRDRNRPLLANADPRQRLRSLLEEREPLYREVADLIIDTSHHTVGQVVTLIRQQWKKPPPS
ncbi:MAG: shikimate kinase AroK [Chromatiales bacterium]